MDNEGEAARTTAVGSTDLGMAIAVQDQDGEAYMSTGTFHGQLGSAAARRASVEPTAAAYHNSAASGGAVPVAVFHLEPGTGVVYANVGDAELVGLQLPGRVVPVYSGIYALQPRRGAGPGVVLAALRAGGVAAVYSGDYALQPRPGAGHGEVLVDLLRYGYYMWQPSLATGHGEVLVGPLPDGTGEVFDSSGNFFAQAQQTLPGIGRAEGIAGALRGRNLGAGYDGSGALVDDLGAVYDNPGMVAQHLRRLLPLAGIGACSVAVNGLAAGPGSPAVAIHLFALFLGGPLLVILHVLRV